MQGAQTRISAALKDVVVLDVDPRSIHKKVSVHDAMHPPLQSVTGTFLLICLYLCFSSTDCCSVSKLQS